MATLQRCEIWTDFECNAGEWKAVLPVDHCTRLVTTTRITRDDEGVVELSKDAAAYEHIADGRVIRFLFTDGSFDEWRIREIEDTSRSARTVRLILQSPLYDLNTGAAVISKTTDGVVDVEVEWKGLSPSDVLTEILAFCPAWWSAGTITPTMPVSMTTNGWLPLRALREVVSAIRAQGVSCELDFRRNGTTGYYLDIVTTIGASASTVDVRTAKNLLSMTRQRDRTKYATEVFPIGATTEGVRATVGRMYVEVTAKSGTTLTVQAPVTGGPVIAFDGQLDGLYLIDDTNAKQLISASGTDQEFDVASATNVTAGRWYRLALNSSGDQITRVRKDPAVSGPIKVVESSTLDGVTNLYTNPAQRAWSGASTDPPDGWVKLSTTALTRTTTAGLWLHGGKSCRMQFTTGAHGLETPTVSVYVPSYATAIQQSLWIYIASYGGGTCVAEFTRDSVVWSTVTLSGYAAGTWHRIDFEQSASGLTGAVRTFKIGVRQTSGGSSNFDGYFDSAQLSFNTDPEPFTEGSAPTRLWSLANNYLTTYSTTPTAYSTEFADLGQWDAASFPYDTVALGATANVRDTDLNVTTSGRIVELVRDWRNPLASRLTVSTRPVDFIGTLTGIAA